MKDGDLGDDDRDEDGPRDPDPEGRVEKYIGVKVKVCILCKDLHLFSLLSKYERVFTIKEALLCFIVNLLFTI